MNWVRKESSEQCSRESPLCTAKGGGRENDPGEGDRYLRVMNPPPSLLDSTRKNSPDFRPQFSSFQQINLAFTVADTVSNIKRGTVDVRNGQ